MYVYVFLSIIYFIYAYVKYIILILHNYIVSRAQLI